MKICHVETGLIPIKPVGQMGWGALPCAGGKPKNLFHYDDPDKLLLIQYTWMEDSVAVRDLQVLMGMKNPTGIYDEKTREKHIEGLNYWGLTHAGVPQKPITGEEVNLLITGTVSSLSWWS